MNINESLTNSTILQELGKRIAAARLARNLTQAALAERASMGKRTVERLESGRATAQLSSFVKICRALGVLDQMDTLIPEQTLSPMAVLKQHGKRRKRASSPKPAQTKSKKWNWGDSQ